MSTIVAVRKHNTAAIASDCQTRQGDTRVPGDLCVYPRKIHKIGGAYVGVVGSTAHHSVLHSLSASHPDLFNFHAADAIFETLRRIHPLLRDEYYLLTKEDDNDQEYESSQLEGLVVSKAGIYLFQSYREVSHYSAFWAVGSGMEYALGALEATYESSSSAKALAETAVRAACKFDTSSGLPVESFEVELEV